MKREGFSTEDISDNGSYLSTVHAVAVQFTNDTRPQEDDISEAHSATDETWYWLKPESSTSGN